MNPLNVDIMQDAVHYFPDIDRTEKVYRKDGQ
jgi:hypothetical protein